MRRPRMKGNDAEFDGKWISRLGDMSAAERKRWSFQIKAERAVEAGFAARAEVGGPSWSEIHWQVYPYVASAASLAPKCAASRHRKGTSGRDCCERESREDREAWRCHVDHLQEETEESGQSES